MIKSIANSHMTKKPPEIIVKSEREQTLNVQFLDPSDDNKTFTETDSLAFDSHLRIDNGHEQRKFTSNLKSRNVHLEQIAQSDPKRRSTVVEAIRAHDQLTSNTETKVLLKSSFDETALKINPNFQFTIKNLCEEIKKNSISSSIDRPIHDIQEQDVQQEALNTVESHEQQVTGAIPNLIFEIGHERSNKVQKQKRQLQKKLVKSSQKPVFRSHSMTSLCLFRMKKTMVRTNSESCRVLAESHSLKRVSPVRKQQLPTPSLYERCQLRKKDYLNKIETIRQTRQAEIVSQCTFKPKILQKKKANKKIEPRDFLLCGRINSNFNLNLGNSFSTGSPSVTLNQSAIGKFLKRQKRGRDEKQRKSIILQALHPDCSPEIQPPIQVRAQSPDQFLRAKYFLRRALADFYYK